LLDVALDLPAVLDAADASDVLESEVGDAVEAGDGSDA
jgi:hypothetical protein